MEHKDKLFKNNSSVGVYLQCPVFGRSMDDIIEELDELEKDSGFYR